VKSAGLWLVVLALCFPLPPFRSLPLAAQETVPGKAESDYRVDENGRIVQRLSWSRSNAHFFEAEIERQTGPDIWEIAAKERTSEFFLETALPPGQYRYRVLSYNVLGRVAATSEWVGVRIFEAKRPVIESLSPAAYYFDAPAETIAVIIDGSDLSEEAELYLAKKTGDRRRTEPLSVFHSADEKRIEAVFPTADLAIAPYELVITNPGGLQARADFVALFRRNLDIAVSLGYSPALPLYGYVFDAFSSPFYPAGFYVRAALIPIKRLWGFIGAEITPRFVVMKTEKDAYTVNGTMTALTLGALFQRWFGARRIAIKLRLGGGAAAITGIQYEHKDGSVSEKVATLLPFVSAGASLEWLAWRGLFVEAGAEYTRILPSNSSAPAFIQLSAGAGWRF
jgi:hypothetical protein